MDHPPSYQDALKPADWLELVAPYVSLRSYAKLCRVSMRFREQFLPRLWCDPIAAARTLGLEPAKHQAWLFWFLKVHARSIPQPTALLVVALDLRGFATSNHAVYDYVGVKQIKDVLGNVPLLFPNLRCLLLNDHEEIEPVDLLRSTSFIASPPPLLMLSISGCRTSLPARFFETAALRNLVSLDLSGGKGVLTGSCLNSQCLPFLRVLKARNHNVDDQAASEILQNFMGQLWSLDLSHNRLTDRTIKVILQCCFTAVSFQSDAHFETEGKIKAPEGMGSDRSGQFQFIEESEWSAKFDHPDLCLTDTPSYIADEARHDENVHPTSRMDGRVMIVDDSPDAVKKAFAGGVGNLPPNPEYDIRPAILRKDYCLTHLFLNGNRFTSDGISKLIRHSGGRLEHFECDRVQIPKSAITVPKRPDQHMKLYGLLGQAHIFRPVFSSNLRVIRAHHSLVTQVPSIDCPNLTSLECLWMAQTAVRPQAVLAFPQAFSPDMNPRLHTLVLTNVPRRGTITLIDELKKLLRSAYLQEELIVELRANSSRRSPPVLPGLRRICLEFEPDLVEDVANFSLGEDFDAEELMSPTAYEFSFFKDTWEPSPAFKEWKETGEDPQKMPSKDACRLKPDVTPEWTGRLTHHPFDKLAPGQEYIEECLKWEGKDVTIKVWVGTGEMTESKAVNSYMRFLRPGSMFDPEPATPAQVLAGVPAGSYIYRQAWDAIMLPIDVAKPTAQDLKSLRDVATEIKSERRRAWSRFNVAQKITGSELHAFRVSDYWTGQLSMTFPQVPANYTASNYWGSNSWR